MAKNEILSLRSQLLEKRITKYRMQILRLKKNKVLKRTEQASVKEKIHNFLLDDENSRLTAGKKETITRRKVKKTRLLNNTLLNLHKTFVYNSGLNVSYETFRRHRPFWVIFPTAASRNTCLCSIYGLLHIDFSENYGCKYGSEIQSAHFGGSKEQLSLHTCLYYSKDSHDHKV
ncbi:hypothetical protein ACJJTC_015549 [Scirpophaga incertulas]